MSDILGFPDRLEECLLAVEVSRPVVRVFPADSGKYQYFGSLVSPDFEGLIEGQRQRLIWDSILKRLSDFDQTRVAFIYTDAPSELPEAISPASPATAHAPAQP